ncbi:unnamed protein product [Lupinus luteus]|uniref:DUF4219 domain-containing protein n=1 Tax=Lupinus luteus TaxID=3873 RepID=A0AAV1XUL2_LUPLU
MAPSGATFPATLPILDGKNWNRWKVQMKAILGYQEVDEIIEIDYSNLEEEATDEQKRVYKENKKKDCKALCLLHQCVDEVHFEKIFAATNSKEAWMIPEISCGVVLISRFMSHPRYSDMVAAKRILRYLKGTIDYGILFPQ